jgi:hypothetical protein
MLRIPLILSPVRLLFGSAANVEKGFANNRDDRCEKESAHGCHAIVT